MTQRVILITGASSGIGKLTAETLAQRGHLVFGTSRKAANGEIVNGVHMLALDVTSDYSVALCVAQVLEQAGSLDVLVNNAGVEMFGALEEITIDEARWIFETNLFGVMRMTKAVLPHMRRRRSGTIINVSSVAGLTGAPIHGAYVTSKYALEGYSESLWHEVASFGVRVALVEPGFFRSEIGSRSRIAQETIADYDDLRHRVITLLEREIADGPDPLPVAMTIVDIAEGRDKKLRHLVGYGTGNMLFKLLMPDALIRSATKRWIQSSWREAMMPSQTILTALAAATGVSLFALFRRRR